MDYGQAFTYLPNSSDNWISKVAMGVVFALLTLFLGLGTIALVGWAIAIARRVIQGQEDVLPEWADLGQIIMDGLKAVALIIIWFIPLLIMIPVSIVIDNFAIQFVFWCCSLIYGLPLSLLLLGVFGQLAADRPFSEVLNPVNAWGVISANWANTIIVWLLAAVGYSLATLVGTILCLIGVFLGITYGYSVIGHLYGQLYSESQGGKAALA
jgi:hypothetical protein